MLLNLHTYFSLRYGTMSIESIIEQAKHFQYTTLAITDINNSTGVFDFVKACKEAGIKPIVGMEFRNEDELLFIALAKNFKGFREMNELITDSNLNKKRLPKRHKFEHCFVIYPFGCGIRDHRENEYTGIRPDQINKIVMEKNKERYVLLYPITYQDKKGYEVHQKLRAVQHNSLLSQLKASQMAGKAEWFISKQELYKLYEQHPVLIQNAVHIAQHCEFEFDFKAIKNKKTFTGTAEDDKQLLRKLAYDGLKYRYGLRNKVALERVEKELEIIDELGFSAYFLITWDIIRYSMSKGYYHVGRGSGANSVVAYCLRITDVCPIELDLYFERFLNPKRKSPPDFDIDFSWKERDDVLDYIFKRYGKKHTALLGAMSTFKDKSIIRELGKIHGLPKEEIDRLIKYPNHALNANDLSKEVLDYYCEIEDYPNMRTIHACGVLISEEPITTYTALDLPPKGFPTVQFDMYQAEDIGFEKFDILSQRGIGHIKEAAEIIFQNKRIKVDVHDVETFKKDKQVAFQLRSGDTIGCFYIESPAMRGLLKKLHCDTYLTLVAASSIIRPGVASSGMMKAYIERFHKPD
ncbi:MAG: PHP domain-containing protein, partial [Bacteroidia bacterium]|nr:PHP domain-containing protein [Bacteroidia bacterium]